MYTVYRKMFALISFLLLAHPVQWVNSKQCKIFLQLKMFVIIYSRQNSFLQ